MNNCKKRDCIYSEVMSGNRKNSATYCNFYGITGMLRGCYGKDVKNCRRYISRDCVGKEKVQIHIGSKKYVRENEKRMKESKCSEEKE